MFNSIILFFLIFLSITVSYPSVVFAHAKDTVPLNKDNQPHGYAKFYHPDGILKREGEYVNGTPLGLWKQYHNNGKLMQESPTVDGQLHGLFKEYHREDGRLISEQPHVRGQRHGLSKWFAANCKQVDTVLYDMGQLPERNSIIHDVVIEIIRFVSSEAPYIDLKEADIGKEFRVEVTTKELQQPCGSFSIDIRNSSAGGTTKVIADVATSNPRVFISKPIRIVHSVAKNMGEGQ